MMDAEAFTLEWPHGTRSSAQCSPHRVRPEVGALDESPSLGDSQPSCRPSPSPGPPHRAGLALAARLTALVRGPEALIAVVRAGGIDDADRLRRRSLRRRRENHRQRDEQRELNHGPRHLKQRNENWSQPSGDVNTEMCHRFARRHPAARACGSLQTHRSPFAVSMRVRA